MVRKGIAILFLTIYLFADSGFGQLLKLPQFIKHYQAHLQKNKDISIWKFISIHYSQSNDKDGDYNEDMKLPFKTVIATNASNSIASLPIQEISIAAPNYGDPINILTIYKPIFFYNNCLSKIWQPPRQIS